jgi:hypothetical protein
MDFGMLPPEINSARMYTGPGAGPMLTAAAAWDGLATELHSTAASYGSVITGLAAVWQGRSSASMAAAVAPYTAWMSTAAAQAEQTATQARAAVAAYETAFAATVPPPIIAANRAVLMSLIATNFLGPPLPRRPLAAQSVATRKTSSRRCRTWHLPCPPRCKAWHHRLPSNRLHHYCAAGHPGSLCGSRPNDGAVAATITTPG